MRFEPESRGFQQVGQAVSFLGFGDAFREEIMGISA
jgi:hypothetical protein